MKRKSTGRYRYGARAWLFAAMIFVCTLVQAQTRQLTIAIGFSLEPYMFDNGRGILSEIVEYSFKGSGASANFLLLSNVEALKAYADGRVDAVGIVRPGMVEGYYSEPVLRLHDKAIVLEDSEREVRSMADLRDGRVLGYSNARNYIGGQYADVVEENTRYREVVHQSEQARELFHHRADVIISDEPIFRFYLKRLRYENTDIASRYYRKYRVFDIFEPVNYHIAFRREEDKMLFDKGFLRLTSEGEHRLIVAKYTELLRQY